MRVARRIGWEPKKLDELGFVGRGKSRHRPRNEPSLYSGPYPFVQTADIMASEFYITSYSKTYSEAGLAQSKMWEPNTLCMTIAGENTAETAILALRACFPDSVVGFIADPEKSDVRFVKYALDTMKKTFRSVTKGATQDNLSLDKLLSFDILTPPLPVQKAIAGILSTYDDLIENNRRRIQILEHMAQALYREWFVNFRFPGHAKLRLVDSPVGKIPQGWNVAPLSELVDFAKGRKPAETRKEPLPEHVPLLLIDALRGGTAEFASPAKMVIADSRDTIMVMDGASSCEVSLGFSGAVGSTLGRFRSKSADVFCPHALYRFLEAKADEFKSKNIGAAIPHANKDYILSQLVTLPPQSVTQQVSDHLEPIQCAIGNFKAQVSNLRRTRDLLLPKLLSGALDVSKLDIETS